MKQIVILAGDRVSKSATPLTPQMRLACLKLLDNDTGDLIGMLTLVPNMPLILKKNIGTEIGLCNGTHCRLSRVIIHPDECPFDIRSEHAAPHFLRKYPLLIIAHVKNPKFAQIPGLEPGEFPIFPYEDTWEFTYYENGKEKKINIRRKQFPVIPGYALTGMTAQGATFDQAIIDLTPPTGKGAGKTSPADAYVLLSRLKNLKGLAILRRFDKSVLAPKLNRELLEEIERLEIISNRS
jgi:hypothetical protein